MITDRIGRHEVLLPVNYNFNEICDILGSFFNQNTRNSEIFLLAVKKKPFKRARDGAYCPITYASRVLSYLTVLLRLKSGQLIANQI